MKMYKGIYFDNYQLDDIAQRLAGRAYVSDDELDLFLCAASTLYNKGSEEVSRQWENRAKWIMDQHWFQSEASFRLDVPEELDYGKWTSMIVEQIDSKLL